MTSQVRRFGPGDVVVGDWAWGVGAWWPHPVIRVNRDSITVGIHRDPGAWLTTQILQWDDIRGVIPAEVDHSLDTAALLRAAAVRLRRGFLSDDQRDSLAAVLLIAGTVTLPTPVTAALHTTRSPPSPAPPTNRPAPNRTPAPSVPSPARTGRTAGRVRPQPRPPQTPTHPTPFPEGGRVAMLAFGYTGGLPDGTDTAWGCRATLTPTGAITVAPEHTDLVGPRAAQLRDHLHHHVGAAWRDRISELLRAGILRPGQAGQCVVYRDSTVVIQAATHDADPDVHVCAYLLTAPPP